MVATEMARSWIVLLRYKIEEIYVPQYDYDVLARTTMEQESIVWDNTIEGNI